MNEPQNTDIEVADLLKLPKNKMYKKIDENVKNRLCESYGDDFNLRICPWDETKDKMFQTMSVYEVAYRLRYPLKWVKKHVMTLGIEVVNLPEKTEDEMLLENEKKIKHRDLLINLKTRNKEIYEAIMSGNSQQSMAEKHGISRNRISQIFEREKKRN